MTFKERLNASKTLVFDSAQKFLISDIKENLGFPYI